MVNFKNADVSLCFSKINKTYLWHLKVYLLQRLNNGMTKRT
ncbi:hypothetical protein NT04LM_0523 [Listeria monocytogenes FSL F2-208]|nr:hypothetical protein NT04LM_0523 [Listeria monocytogenes FSL F2-208]